MGPTVEPPSGGLRRALRPEVFPVVFMIGGSGLSLNEGEFPWWQWLGSCGGTASIGSVRVGCSTVSVRFMFVVVGC